MRIIVPLLMVFGSVTTASTVVAEQEKPEARKHMERVRVGKDKKTFVVESGRRRRSPTP